MSPWNRTKLRHDRRALTLPHDAGRWAARRAIRHFGGSYRHTLVRRCWRRGAAHPAAARSTSSTARRLSTTCCRSGSRGLLEGPPGGGVAARPQAGDYFGAEARLADVVGSSLGIAAIGGGAGLVGVGLGSRAPDFFGSLVAAGFDVFFRFLRAFGSGLAGVLDGSGWSRGAKAAVESRMAEAREDLLHGVFVSGKSFRNCGSSRARVPFVHNGAGHRRG